MSYETDTVRRRLFAKEAPEPSAHLEDNRRKEKVNLKGHVSRRSPTLFLSLF